MTEFAFENVSDCVFHHAAHSPQAPALIDGSETITYGALADLVRQASIYLASQGIKAHDRVGIALTNSIERVALALALMRIGAIGIELPTETTAETYAALVARFAMHATLVEPGGPNTSAPITLTIQVHWRAEVATLTGDARYHGDPADLRIISLSSGSTGLPKGLVCSHQHRIVRSRMTLGSVDFYNAHDKPAPLVLAAPASTNLVWGMMICHLFQGGPVVLLPTYRLMIDLVREVARWDDAIFPVPPGLANLLLAHAGPNGALFPRMRALISAGQAVAPHLKQTFSQRLTPNVFEFYGSGGVGLLTCIGPKEAAEHPHSVGKPVSYPGVEVEIAGADGQALPQGSIGQLRVRGPNTAISFFNPEDNFRGNERFEGGWYYLGEIASINRDGYIILEGRIADAIKSGGQITYPPEIEAVMTQHPDILEVAVVGRTADQGGEDIVAFVVGRNGFNHQNIIAYCQANLPVAKRPRYIFYINEMPRTGNGKINRMALKTAPLQKIEPI
jgi:acyl-CoA synthetase (AMP-forming)/AMP-acid ligase II